VGAEALCNFSYSLDGKTFSPLGESFSARQGRWIGAKVGIFAIGSGGSSEMGYADFDWFRVE
jgi:beta-xylosidase